MLTVYNVHVVEYAWVIMKKKKEEHVILVLGNVFLFAFYQ